MTLCHQQQLSHLTADDTMWVVTNCVASSKHRIRQINIGTVQTYMQLQLFRHKVIDRNRFFSLSLTQLAKIENYIEVQRILGDDGPTLTQ
jgi:hypothetical protein